VFAVGAIDDALPNVLGVEHIRHELVVGTREQEVSTGELERIVSPQPFNELVYGTFNGCLRVSIQVLAEDGKQLAIKNELDIGIASRAGRTQLVWPHKQHPARACELDLLYLGRDDLDARVEGK
jgi:hypothetical protein